MTFFRTNQLQAGYKHSNASGNTIRGCVVLVKILFCDIKNYLQVEEVDKTLALLNLRT